MPTFSTLPETACLRLFTNVSVIAETRLIEPLIQIAVSMQCARRSPVTPEPAAFTSSRQVPAPPCGTSGIDRPVLQEAGAIVEDLSELSRVDDLLDERDGRDAAVIVPDGVGDAGLLDRAHHRQRFLGVARQRLLAEHHLAGLRARRWRSRRAGRSARRCRSRRCPCARRACFQSVSTDS